jgi:hypothetical protein
MEVYTYYIGRKVSIYHDQIKVPKKIVCISYKWSDEKKIHHLVWDYKKETKEAFTQYRVSVKDGKISATRYKKGTPSKMLEEFNNIARQADYLIGHNGQSFDVREIRSEMALRGHKEPWCETPVIDTLKDYQRVFRFASNKLDAVAKALGLAQKSPMCLQDWIDVGNGDERALKKMVKYCDQDVRVLEAVHKRLDYYVPPQASKLRFKQEGIRGHAMYSECLRDGCKGRMIKYGRYKYKGQDAQQYLCQTCFKVTRPGKL